MGKLEINKLELLYIGETYKDMTIRLVNHFENIQHFINRDRYVSSFYFTKSFLKYLDSVLGSNKICNCDNELTFDAEENNSAIRGIILSKAYRDDFLEACELIFTKEFLTEYMSQYTKEFKNL